MPTLPKKQLKFNRNFKLSHAGGQITSDGGLALVVEFMHQANFDGLIEHHVIFNDQRRYCDYTMVDLVRQIVLMLIAGYDTDSAANWLAHDPVFSLFLNHKVASQATISRFWHQIVAETITSLRAANQALLNWGWDQQRTMSSTTVIDLDSTHSDTFGHQEGTAYNAHYGAKGYHPMVAFNERGDCLKSVLRPGNTYTGKNCAAFLKSVVANYQTKYPLTKLLVRADSGFAMPELYDFCEDHQMRYVVCLKWNPRLGKLVEQQVQQHVATAGGTDFTHEFQYQADKWSIPRRVCVESRWVKNDQDQWHYQHIVVVTNLDQHTTPAQVIATYRQRGQMENYIREAKLGFFFDKTDSATLMQNEARMLISLLAYNVINLMRQLCFPPQVKPWRINTLRRRLFKIGGRLVRGGRQYHLKLSTAHVDQKIFNQILVNIQVLR